MSRIASPAPSDPSPGPSRLKWLQEPSNSSPSVSVWDGELGQYRVVDLRDTSDRHWANADTIAAVEGRRTRPVKRSGREAGRLRHLLAAIRDCLPSISSPATATDHLAEGYLQMARRYEERGDHISAQMAIACAKAIRQAANARGRTRRN